MRRIDSGSRFRRDLKRVGRSHFAERAFVQIEEVIDLLRRDEVLPHRFRDHSLSGDLAGFRECHVLPDLLLIYRKPDEESLELLRIGSHSDLF